VQNDEDMVGLSLFSRTRHDKFCLQEKSATFFWRSPSHKFLELEFRTEVDATEVGFIHQQPAKCLVGC